VPAAHCTWDVLVGQEYPAEQEVHCLASAPEYMPAVHGVQELDPASANVPALHVVQDVAPAAE
jgi:hypothetical protein